MLVRQLDESEFGARPEDELLGDARRVDRGERGDIEKVGDEVAIGDGVDAVAKDARKAQLLRDRRGVHRMRRAGEGARAKRRDRRAFARLRDPLAIPAKRLDVREQVMRKRDGLCALHVRVAREDRVDLAGRPTHERLRQLERGAIELVEHLDHEEAEIERNLIVPAARGVELPGDRAGALLKDLFDR